MLYLHYLLILRQLDECYDQIVHPQKRLLLKTLLDQTIGMIIAEIARALKNVTNP